MLSLHVYSTRLLLQIIYLRWSYPNWAGIKTHYKGINTYFILYIISFKNDSKPPFNGKIHQFEMKQFQNTSQPQNKISTTVKMNMGNRNARLQNLLPGSLDHNHRWSPFYLYLSKTSGPLSLPLIVLGTANFNPLRIDIWHTAPLLFNLHNTNIADFGKFTEPFFNRLTDNRAHQAHELRPLFIKIKAAQENESSLMPNPRPGPEDSLKKTATAFYS